MIITIQEIYRDTRYFFITKIGMIVLISIILTFFTNILELFVKSHVYMMSIIENQIFNNVDSIKTIIDNINKTHGYETLKYSIFKIIELLTNKTLLLSSIIALISISSHKKKSILLFFQYLLQLLPNLFAINFISFLIIQISYVFFIFPGIILSILLMLSPIIVSFKEHSLIGAIVSSIYVSGQYIKIIGPVILLWICGKLFLTTVLSHIIIINRQFSCFILNVGINIIYSILTIYLFRFYMLCIRSINHSKSIGCIT